jgi:hypothetical protein
MIGPKVQPPTRADEANAYELATLRDDNTCLFMAWDCSGGVQRDHRQNRRPGNTIVENLQCLCAKHHQWKTEHPRDALRDGWAVPSWGDPTSWPARRWVRDRYNVLRKSWVIYDADGGWRVISIAEALQVVGGVDAEEAADTVSGEAGAA